MLQWMERGVRVQLDVFDWPATELAEAGTLEQVIASAGNA
jgi:hypothetical protein